MSHALRFPILSAALLSVVACADSARLGGLPADHPLEVALVAAESEIDVHRDNVAATRSLDALRSEVARHDVAVAPIYRELDRQLGDMSTCAGTPVRVEFSRLMAGIAATELGRDEALLGMTSVADAQRIADAYAGGVASNLDKIDALSAQQTGCF